jgi:hypothetical protein
MTFFSTRGAVSVGTENLMLAGRAPPDGVLEVADGPASAASICCMTGSYCAAVIFRTFRAAEKNCSAWHVVEVTKMRRVPLLCSPRHVVHTRLGSRCPVLAIHVACLVSASSAYCSYHLGAAPSCCSVGSSEQRDLKHWYLGVLHWKLTTPHFFLLLSHRRRGALVPLPKLSQDVLL